MSLMDHRGMQIALAREPRQTTHDGAPAATGGVAGGCGQVP